MVVKPPYTMYPRIDAGTPRKEVLSLLAAQVTELESRMGREAALNAVVNNRYNGRYGNLRWQVKRLVSVPKQPAKASSSQTAFAFTSGQYAGIAWDELHNNAPVVK